MREKRVISSLFLVAAAMLAAPSAQAVLGCPASMRLFGDAGTSRSFCVDIARSAAVTYPVAVNNCGWQGKALCNLDEWSIACADLTGSGASFTTAPGSAGGPEWVDTPAETASIRFTDTMNKRVTMGSATGSCTTSNSQAITSSVAYRCCIR